jgi:uncharacterized iron-regulated membrane protein
MAPLSTILHHPRKLWLRRAFFQVHLWMGVLLSLYVGVIGLSGSALVWQDEMRAFALRGPEFHGTMAATPELVMANARAAYPGESVTYVLWPRERFPLYSVYLRNVRGARRIVRVNANTGRVLPPEQRDFSEWLYDLHANLLMGRTGFLISCWAGVGLLVLSLTGLVLWWPGVRLWTRGFYVSLHHAWKRVNYDAHNAVGIWCLLIVSMWCVTGIYFLTPDGMAKAVGMVSPLRGMKPPVAVKPKTLGAPVLLEVIVARARGLTPNGFVSGVSIPAIKSGNYVANVELVPNGEGNFTHRDVHTFAADGTLLATWHYGRNQTLGDWTMWLMDPLHFGTVWGTTVKVLWTVLGLSLPVLALTGLLMYWNRYLGKRWRSLRA